MVNISMPENKLPIEYVLAEGPQGLAKVLNAFLAKTKDQALDPAFSANTEHYILYQLGNQNSLIKVDMSKQPYQFRYFDKLGRPATKAVKETIADFLWNQCGEKERVGEAAREAWYKKKFGDPFTLGEDFHDDSKALLQEENHFFLTGVIPAMVSKEIQDSSLAHATDILQSPHRVSTGPSFFNKPSSSPGAELTIPKPDLRKK